MAIGLESVRVRIPEQMQGAVEKRLKQVNRSGANHFWGLVEDDLRAAGLLTDSTEALILTRYITAGKRVGLKKAYQAVQKLKKAG